MLWRWSFWDNSDCQRYSKEEINEDDPWTSSIKHTFKSGKRGRQADCQETTGQIWWNTFYDNLKRKATGDYWWYTFYTVWIVKRCSKVEGGGGQFNIHWILPHLHKYKGKWGHCKEYLGVSFSFYLKDTFAFHPLSCEANNWNQIWSIKISLLVLHSENNKHSP